MLSDIKTRSLLRFHASSRQIIIAAKRRYNKARQKRRQGLRGDEKRRGCFRYEGFCDFVLIPFSSIRLILPDKRPIRNSNPPFSFLTLTNIARHQHALARAREKPATGTGFDNHQHANSRESRAVFASGGFDSGD
jgi:hypothetical protein